MVNSWQFVVLLVTSLVVTTSSHVMSRQADQPSDDLTTLEPPRTSTEPHSTTIYPPSDPNDECHGCPGGQICLSIIPPCYRGPSECFNHVPDPSLNCEQYVCKPIPMCLPYYFSG
ncbi:uncharacterized protein LOC131932510 [Physella acuta]|uniref:uncharacterized protein LOC131932510 n=1 Tax=Physella acuta TaxID=109671 RepID=UPI0027DE8B4B|nr:uncharacterized protein LOC131932510 [Physella acuta]